MDQQIERIKKTRLFLITLVKSLSVQQLNQVPAGFNNNIIWNLGHLIAVQQGVCYGRAGLKPVVDDKYMLLYKTGTKPEQAVDGSEVATIKELLLSTLDLLKIDYQNKVFYNYVPWTTRYDVTLSDIDDAIQFLAYHEGLHSGYITALMKLVK